MSNIVQTAGRTVARVSAVDNGYVTIAFFGGDHEMHVRLTEVEAADLARVISEAVPS